ncbi:restriction endonuclease [Patescibacteria group bacterium]
MDIIKIKKYIKNKNIKLVKARSHSKASEKYIDVVFSYTNQPDWDGSIPYFYRRTGLFLEAPEEIAQLIEKAYEAVKQDNAKKWITAEKKLWRKEYKGKTVTKPFFDKLLSLKWNCVDGDLPPNRNWARRIQDIKEMGYVLATNTSKYNPKLKRNTTQIILVPLEKGPQTGYEVFSPKLRKRIIKVLGSYDAYEGKVRPSQSLLPDHKFPEISWDDKTKEDNPDNMSDEEIRAKFQLLDNQRNLEKREACRRVVQSGKLGTIFGIEYYINGNDNWPNGVPKVGKASEKGWKLCPWYDIEAWRESLNEFIKRKSNKKLKRKKR